jgi:hypothetical protein
MSNTPRGFEHDEIPGTKQSSEQPGETVKD